LRLAEWLTDYRTTPTDELAAAELRRLSAQVEALEADRAALLEWQARGELLLANPGIGFRIGAWWADRPWRDRAAEQSAAIAKAEGEAPCGNKP